MDLYQVLKKQKTSSDSSSRWQHTGQQDSQQQHQFYPERLSCYSFTSTISQILSHDFKRDIKLSFHMSDFLFHRCSFLGFAMQASQPHHENSDTHRFISSSAFCRIQHLHGCYFHSEPKPITFPHHIFLLLFSSVPKEVGGRPPLPKHPLSKEGQTVWMWAAWAVPQTKQVPWCIGFQMSN